MDSYTIPEVNQKYQKKFAYSKCLLQSALKYDIDCRDPDFSMLTERLLTDSFLAHLPLDSQ